MLLAALLFAATVGTHGAAPPTVEAPGDGGIVYGGDVGAMVTAPSGWVFDATSGVDQGLHAVIYPKGSTWANATEVMYVNFGRLEAGRTLLDFIAADLAKQKEGSPSLAIEVAESIALVGGAKAEVRLLSGDAWKNYEAVAYVAQTQGVAIFVLSCRNENGFRSSLAAFRQMVASSSLMQVEVKQ